MSSQTEIILADMTAWEAFAADNRETLENAYGSLADALFHARCGGLTIGGGAAPLFIVTFSDGEPLDPMRGAEFPFAENH